MVRLGGPLASDQASGVLAGGLAFRRTRAGTILCTWTPGKKPTSLQAAQNQSAVKALSQIWASLPEAWKAVWAAQGERLHTSPYHAYLKANLRWLDAGRGASVDPEHAATLYPGSGGSINATLQGRNVLLKIAATYNPYGWLITWHRDPTSPFTSSLPNWRATQNWLGGIAGHAMDFDVPVGTWKYKIRKHAVDGYILDGGAYATVTVT